MTGTRGVKHEKSGQGIAWLDVMLDLLQGGALGAVCSVAVLAVSAVLISSGMMSDNKADAVVVAACLLGGLAGGLFAVRHRNSAPLPTGLGAGGVLFLLLLTAGVLLYDAPCVLLSSGVVAGSCLCGGGLAGVFGRKPKGRRRR